MQTSWVFALRVTYYYCFVYNYLFKDQYKFAILWHDVIKYKNYYLVVNIIYFKGCKIGTLYNFTNRPSNTGQNFIEQFFPYQMTMYWWGDTYE